MSMRLRRLGPCLSQRGLHRHQSCIDLYAQDPCDELSREVCAFLCQFCHLLLVYWTEPCYTLCHLLAHLAGEELREDGVREARNFQSFGELPPVKSEVGKVIQGHANPFVDEMTQVLDLLDPGG